MAEFTLFNSSPQLKTCSKCGFPAAKFRAKRNLCSKCHAEYHARYYQKNKERYRDNGRRTHLRAKYGLTPQQYDEMYASQGGACAICLSPANKLNIDHCHESGRVRGLLCWPCNSSIGKFKESADLLEAAARYLRGHGLPTESGAMSPHSADNFKGGPCEQNQGSLKGGAKSEGPT